MNTYQTENPEAFTAEYEEEQQILAELSRPEEAEVEFTEVPEADVCDIVREYEESLTDEQREALNTQREAEWQEFYRKGGEYPNEFE